jgi:hypothetical protein
MAAYPRQFVKLAIFLAVAALGLEALQHLTPDRLIYTGDVEDRRQTKASAGAVRERRRGLRHVSLSSRIQATAEARHVPRSRWRTKNSLKFSFAPLAACGHRTKESSRIVALSSLTRPPCAGCREQRS